MNQSHKYRKLALIMLLPAILMLSSIQVQAFSVSSVDFSWAGYQITHISPNNPVPANINFTYALTAGEELDKIVINALDMNNDPRKQAEYSSISVALGSCTSNSCIIANKVIKTNKNSIKLIFTATLKNGSVIVVENTKTLQTDSTRPKVKSLTTNGCFQDKCYVTNSGTNRVTIVLEDSVATFNRKKVAFRLGSETGYVVNCSSMTCYGFVAPMCNDGQTMTLALANYNGQPSQDDAGNSVEPYVTTAICDSQPASIIEEKATSSSKLDAITTMDSIELQVNATDTFSPLLNMTIIGDTINANNVTVTCSRASQEAGSQFVCRGSIKPAVDVAGEYDLNYYVTDLAGNVVASKLKVKILLIGNMTARDLWDIKSVKQSNNRMTKPNILYERTFYVEVGLAKKSGNPTIVTLANDGNTCFPQEDNLTGYKNDITSMSIVKLDKESNKVYLKLTLRESGTGQSNRYAELSTLKYLCPLKITSKEGNYYYSIPEAQNFSISIALEDGPTMDSLLQQEAAAVKSRVESKKKITDAYDENLRVVEQYCQLCGYSNTLSAGLGVVEGGLSALQITKPAAVGPGAASDVLNSIGTSICKPGVELCKFMTCDADWQKYLVGKLDSKWMNDMAAYGGFNNFSDSLNPQKSIVVAAAMVCLPALNNHIKSLNGIDCHYLECITGGIANSAATLESCQQQKSTSECIFIYGNALDTIPFVSLVRDTFERLSDIVKDPVALFGMAAPLICKAIPKGTEMHSVCVVPIGVISSLNILKTVLNIFKPSGDQGSMCGDVSTVNVLDMRDWRKIGNFPADHNFTLSTETGNTVTDTANGVTVNCDGVTGNCRTPSNRVMIMPKMDVDDKGETKTYGAIFFDTKTNKRYVENDLKDGLKRLAELQQGVLAEEKDKLTTERENLIKNGAPAQQNPRLIEIDNELKALTAGITDADSFIKSLDDLQRNGLSLLSLNNRGEATDDSKYSQRMRDMLAEARTQEDRFAILEEYGLIDSKGKFVGAAKFYAAIRLSGTFKNRWKKDMIDTYGITFEKYLSEIETAEDGLRQFLINSREDHEYEVGMKNSLVFMNDVRDKDTLTEKEEKKLKDTLSLLLTTDEADKILKAMKEKKISLDDYLDENEDTDDFLEMLEESVEELADQYDETLQEKLDENEKAQRNARNAMKEVEYYGSLKATMKTAWGTASGLVSLRGLFNTEWGIWPDHSMIGKVSKFFKDWSRAEVKFCSDANIEPTAGVGDGVVLNQVGSKSYRSGAYITGRRSGMTVLPNGNYYFNYWISGSVSSVKNTGLTFRVVLVDSNGAQTDFTRNLTRTDTPVVSIGVPYSFGTPRPFTFNTTTIYDRVCIDFGGQQLSQYFDYVSLTDNKLCQKFMAEE